MELLLLLLAGLAACGVAMAATWLLAHRIDNYGIVDVAWSGCFTGLAVLYAVMAAPTPARAGFVLVLACAWSLRLTIYLYRRVKGLHPVEDARYQDLRRSWGARLRSRMFWFFQAQALAAASFSLPFALALLNPSPSLEGLEWVGAAVWLVGMMGESTADWQLARFKADPRTRGRVCDVGLWRYSRHPNYFFEWTIWCAFAIVAWAAPLGFLALACPAAMLWLLLGVTGIPATEAAAVARRGDAYREYQRTTSAFVPWIPRRAGR